MDRLVPSAQTVFLSYDETQADIAVLGGGVLAEATAAVLAAVRLLRLASEYVDVREVMMRRMLLEAALEGSGLAEEDGFTGGMLVFCQGSDAVVCQANLCIQLSSVILFERVGW